MRSSVCMLLLCAYVMAANAAVSTTPLDQLLTPRNRGQLPTAVAERVLSFRARITLQAADADTNTNATPTPTPTPSVTPSPQSALRGGDDSPVKPHHGVAPGAGDHKLPPAGDRNGEPTPPAASGTASPAPSASSSSTTTSIVIPAVAGAGVAVLIMAVAAPVVVAVRRMRARRAAAAQAASAVVTPARFSPRAAPRAAHLMPRPLYAVGSGRNIFDPLMAAAGAAAVGAATTTGRGRTAGTAPTTTTTTTAAAKPQPQAAGRKSTALPPAVQARRVPTPPSTNTSSNSSTWDDGACEDVVTIDVPALRRSSGLATPVPMGGGEVHSVMCVPEEWSAAMAAMDDDNTEHYM